MSRLTTAAVLSLIAAAPATALPGGPTGFAAAPGCTIQCVTSAAVTSTATGATVDVRTSVPASVTVEAAPLDAPLGITTGSPAHVSVPVPAMRRTVVLTGLVPDTGYRIAVRARDTAGRTSVRTGVFRTRAARATVDRPDPQLGSGAGCTADCIISATAANSPDVAGRTRLRVRLSAPGRIALEVRQDGGAAPRSWSIASANGATGLDHTLDGLQHGRRYTVTVRAEDLNGAVHTEAGAFRTPRARAVVTFQRIAILDDGDRGANRGELSWDHMVNGRVTGTGFARRSTGSVFSPGAAIIVPADGDATLDLRVLGTECDAPGIGNCFSEALPSSSASPAWATGHGSSGRDDWAWARGAWTLEQLRAPSALPPWFGGGATPPPGHDHYVMFETTGTTPAFRVMATIDLQVVS